MIIIKLGGSVIQKNISEINPQLFEFISIVKNLNEKVIITNGGGPFCRILQNSLKENGAGDNDTLGKIGVGTDNLFGEFLKLNFPTEKTFPKVITSEEILLQAKQQVNEYQFFFGGAWEIGHSSDFNAVRLALEFEINEVFRITNVDYVYDKDPKKFPEARKIERMDWEEYMSIIGNKEFVPGGNYPFDPVASKIAMENRIRVYLTSIDKVIERNSLSTENFIGSVIG